MGLWALIGAIVLIGFAISNTPAWAQRVDDNVTTQSGDAFGRSVGSEKSGIYSSSNVRGFDPVDAGNARLEDLYFDQLDRVSGRLTEGSTIRVGVSAIGYPFPAPTGLVDYELTKAGAVAQGSLAMDNGRESGGGFGGGAEYLLPLDGERLGLMLAGGGRLLRSKEGYWQRMGTFATTLTHRPNANAEYLLFTSAFYNWDNEAAPIFFPIGDNLPPQIERGKNLSQSWTDRNSANWVSGGVAKFPIGDVRIESGLFYSTDKRKTLFADIFSGVTSDGKAASRRIIADGNRLDKSWSGEVRLVYRWTAGRSDHSLIAGVRGRSRERRFGGSVALPLSPPENAVPGDPTPFTILQRDVRAEPSYILGPKNLDRVTQIVPGIAYSFKLDDMLTFDTSLSRNNYKKRIDFAAPAVPNTTSTDKSLLWNVNASVALADGLAVYAGIARGQEEALIAPEVAINNAEAPPAISTKQVEAGIRLALNSNISLVAGVFSIEKPYFNLDPTRRFRELGTLRNRGMELSVSGELAPGLTVLGGMLLLDPTISGEAVENGLIGNRPIGQIRRKSVLNIDWRPDGGESPWSFDISYDGSSKRFGNAMNTLRAPAINTFDIGARYRFSIFERDAIIRTVLFNSLNEYGWFVSSSGGFTYNSPRRLMIQLISDL